MSEQSAKGQVLAGLQELILWSATSAAGEQYQPCRDPDASDDVIKWRKREMEELRRLRHRFEEIVTGVLVDEPVWEVCVLFKERQQAMDFLASLNDERSLPFATVRAR